MIRKTICDDIFWQSVKDVHVLLDRCNIPYIPSTIIIFFLRSPLQRKWYNTQEIYPELIALRFFFNCKKWRTQNKKNINVFYPIFANFVTCGKKSPRYTIHWVTIIYKLCSEYRYQFYEIRNYLQIFSPRTSVFMITYPPVLASTLITRLIWSIKGSNSLTTVRSLQ